jgi:acyl-CoA thioesterase I
MEWLSLGQWLSLRQWLSIGQRLWLGVLLLALVAPQPARAAGGLACDLPTEFITPADPLTHVAAALGKKARLDILALGSGATVGDAGTGAGPALAFHAPEGAFPIKMMDALKAMRPTIDFHLTIKGGRNMTADAMLPVLRQELAAHHYDLVLWQTGTVEAVRGARPDLLHAALDEGADEVANANADLVLIDLQFSRFLRANADLSPYEAVFQQVSGEPGVTLFHRLDLTQLWVGNGEVDLERVSRDQRDATISLLNTCLGEALARYVLAETPDH